jgi:hypothetical protein
MTLPSKRSLLLLIAITACGLGAVYQPLGGAGVEPVAPLAREAVAAFVPMELQAAGEAAAPVQPEQPAPAPEPPAPPSDGYTYQPEGRRDPFLSLLRSGTEPRAAAVQSEGPSSLAVSDISVRGVLQSKGSLVGIIQAPDARTYLVHDGEKLQDGIVKAVTPTGLVIIQDVNDPLSLVKQREVHKPLRSFEETK